MRALNLSTGTWIQAYAYFVLAALCDGKVHTRTGMCLISCAKFSTGGSPRYRVPVLPVAHGKYTYKSNFCNKRARKTWRYRDVLIILAHTTIFTKPACNIYILICCIYVSICIYFQYSAPNTNRKWRCVRCTHSVSAVSVLQDTMY